MTSFGGSPLDGAPQDALTEADGRWPARAARALHRALSGYRRLVAGLIYGGIAVASLWLGFLTRFDFHWRPAYNGTFLCAALALIPIRLTFAALFGVTMGRWRFVSTADVVRLAAATASGSIVFFVVCTVLPITPAVPRSVIALEWVLTVYFTAALWLTYRMAYEQVRHHRIGQGQPLTRVLIVGAGEAGNLLVREIVRFPTGYRAVGIVDDDSTKWGSSIHGVSVLGPTSHLARLAGKCRAEEIIIAVPSASPADLRRIVHECEGTELPFKVLPGIAEVLAGDVRVAQIRELRIEDLLGREPIDLDLPELSSAVGGSCVLITGAAGSIGSELSRQVAHHRPARLVLVDRAETELYYLELELRSRFPRLDLRPVTCDVSDAPALEHVFSEHRPQAVYHAAAYKHVPMMESNVRAAVWNNVYGSLWVADAAGRHAASKCVLVSTDKAVCPSSIMGATKRLAEMAFVDIQSRYPRTAYTAVRFGNVLGSNGSVIPIFQRQLARGEPLTVTHPDATRYFMTIPEAVQLILQASLLKELRGRIAMLEMGEPVRIMELAQNLLRLTRDGRRRSPGICVVGLRPGEKLHEELVAPEEESIPTPVAKIRVIAHGPSATRTLALLDAWKHDIHKATAEELLSRLQALFPSVEASGISKASAPLRAQVAGVRLAVESGE